MVNLNNVCFNCNESYEKLWNKVEEPCGVIHTPDLGTLQKHGMQNHYRPNTVQQGVQPEWTTVAYPRAHESSHTDIKPTTDDISPIDRLKRHWSVKLWFLITNDKLNHLW